MVKSILSFEFVFIFNELDKVKIKMRAFISIPLAHNVLYLSLKLAMKIQKILGNNHS